MSILKINGYFFKFTINMSVPSFENFLFVPTTNTRGTLYELVESERFDKNSFVILAYQNPQTKKPSKKFYKIVSEREYETSSPLDPYDESSKIQLQSKTSKNKYVENVLRLKNEIQKGNIYEINYCIHFFAENIIVDPLIIFSKLNLLAKAPYACVLKLGNDYIISASPELFIKKEGTILTSKPIKGTIRRGQNAEEDAFLKNELQTNLKERTENVMAVDVARNDFSVFAKQGSVSVNKLYNIETFETVHQMVSTVRCELKEETMFDEIIDATFPMASMTGAPKIRAMQLIDETENFHRNYYSGAMGLIDENGDYSLSVIIRSIFYNSKRNSLSISVGGAITYLSDPEKEYEECLLKAKALLKVLNAEITN